MTGWFRKRLDQHSDVGVHTFIRAAFFVGSHVARVGAQVIGQLGVE